MAKKRKQKHWTKRLHVDEPVSEKAIRAIPASTTLRVTKTLHIAAVTLCDAYQAYWSKNGKCITLSPIDPGRMYMSLELKPYDCTWGRFVALLAAMRLVPMDSEVAELVTAWTESEEVEVCRT